MSETRVILLTDVVDSTKLNQQLGDSTMAGLWAGHDQATRELLRAHRGREIGRTDGFLVMFDSVDDALDFAAAYHRRLAELPRMLRARVGVHLGPVKLRENTAEDRALGATPFEVDGIAVPAAARLMSAANGGQTLVSAEAAAAVTATGWLRRSHGHWRFKGLEQPVEVIEFGDDGSVFAPPPDSEKAYRVVQVHGQWCAARDLPHRLPAERDAFVGREPLLRQLAEMIDAAARLVTLLGTGGIGKTRLALRYARSRLGDFAGGAWFCDLSAATGADGVLRSVAQGLDIPLDSADPLRQIGAVIAGRGRCLIVLDNFEQVARHSEETLGAWMQAAPQALFIATSREVLGIGGENVLAVDPLSTEEATQMFRQRAMAAGVRSQDVAGGMVDSLVEMLDRLPLAIEIAAVRLRVMPLAELLRGMNARFKLLVRRGGAQDRQATLRTTIDWSWALLSAEERSALAQLSVFEGGCTLAAAQAVLDLSDVSADAMLFDALQGLMEKSMLGRGPNDRYTLLRTVQDYAAERLDALGGAKSTRARHWRYFAGLAETEVSERRCDDLDNIIAACRRSTDARDAEAAVRTLVHAAGVLIVEGPVRALDDLVTRVRGMDRLTSGQHAEVAWVAGKMHYHLGRGADAVAEYRAGLDAARAGGDGLVEARLSCALVEPLIRTGDPAAAEPLLAEAERICRENPEPSVELIVRITIGLAAHFGGQLAQARQHLEKALACARTFGFRRREGSILSNLGTLHYQAGERERALACFEQALAIGLETGDRRRAAVVRNNVAWAHLEAGEYERAVTELSAVVFASREIGYAHLEAIALGNLGSAHLELSQAKEASLHLRAAVALNERLEDRKAMLENLRLLAKAMGHLDDLAALREALATALTIAEQLGDSAQVSEIEAEISAISPRDGRLPQALT